MTDRGRPLMRRNLKLATPDVALHHALILFRVLVLLPEVVFQVLEPWPLKVIVDTVTTFRGAKVSHQPVSVRLLIGYGVTLLLIVGLYTLSNYLTTICFALVGSWAATSLRAHVFRHVRGLSQQFRARNRNADTMQRIIGDAARMQKVAITAGLPLMANVITLLAMVVVMFVLGSLLASVVLVAIAALAVTSGPASWRVTAASRQTRKGEGQLVNTAQESLASTRVVQAYGLENLVEENFTSTDCTSSREGIRLCRYAARLERTTDIIVGLTTAIMLAGGGLWMMRGVMSPGDLVLFITCLRTITKPLCDMAKYTGRIARVSASGERVADLMEITSDVVTLDEPVRPDVVMGTVRFGRVVTEYNGIEVLRGLCPNVRPNEQVAVIGPSGAGKSTLVSLLVRTVDLISEYVQFDGHRLINLDLTRSRTSVFLLHQEAVLFTDTIHENIRIDHGDVTDAEVGDAVRAANAHDFITEQPDGYDAVAGGRGGTLSSGQRQRTAIARALLCYSPVVVLDEATIGPDPEAASLVLDAVGHLAMGRTILAVTRDAEVALRAIRVVWTENGCIRFNAALEELVATSDVLRVWVRANGRNMDPIKIGDSR